MKTHTNPVRQRGAVLLFSLIALTILLISCVALVRSFNTSLFNAGNVAFKRDLLNQSERVWPVVLATMQTGALSTPEARAKHLVSSNYYANTLWTIHSPSVPEALLDDGTFYTVGSPANDIWVAEQGVLIRYMVERLCSSTGLESTLGADKCTMTDSGEPPGMGAAQLKDYIPPPAQVVYRLTVRVTGPRNTQAFYQSTFAL